MTTYFTEPARSRRVGPALFLGLLLCSPLACKSDDGPARPLPPEVPARRAADSFVRCLERAGGQCVDMHTKQGAWDAFSILGWLSDGSPVAILQALPAELNHHTSRRSIQQRFVTLSQSLRERVRGAECKPEQVVSVGEMVPKMRQRVEQRMRKLGLWSADMQRVVDGLTQEATEGLSGGYVVEMSCYGDPYELYVATTTDQETERQIVVGMLATLPTYLGGKSPSRDIVEGRLGSRSVGLNAGRVGLVREGTVDSQWIPIPVEEF